MKLDARRITWTLAILAMVLTALPGEAQSRRLQSQGRTYEVTITNLTRGQVFSPPIVYSHRSSFQLFTPGQPAIPELAGVAEDANGDPLVALLTADARVADVSVGDDVILPGESMTVRINAPGNARLISLLGMLVTTNDAFYAAGSRAPSYQVHTYAQAWDAGSELNTQDCAHIPGPPCFNGGVRVEDDAEGYVYIHAGIQDRGDLDPMDHDWRNPVALVKIVRANR